MQHGEVECSLCLIQSPEHLAKPEHRIYFEIFLNKCTIYNSKLFKEFIESFLEMNSVWGNALQK